jgi:quinol monooxygenase YgiN
VGENTLRVVARLKAKPEKTSELRALLMGLLAPTRQESGCIAYDLLENEEDPTEFNFVEEWRDGKALDAHFETAHIRNALGRLPELLAEELDVRRYRLVG